MKLPRKTLLTIFGLLFPAFAGGFLIIINLYTYLEPITPRILLFAIVIAVGLLMAGLITILVWWLFSATVIHPLKEINRVAKIIVSGNLGMRVVHSSKDEIGELASNINNMINNLTRGMQGMASALGEEKNKELLLAQNNAELMKAKAKDEALLGSIGEAVIAIDQTGKIILFNASAVALTGYTQSEALGKNYREVLNFESEKGKQPIPDFITPALKGHPINELIRIMLITKANQSIPITQVTSPIIDQMRQITGGIIVLKDITRERQLDKLKDEFLSVASHELRTPMTAIKGLVSMIFEGDYGEINPDLKEPLADIASSTERLIELVNDMLDVSRIESGRTKYSLSQFNLNDVINEILKLLHPIADKKAIQLKFNPTSSSNVQADANKVKQILSNLIGNSLKFTDQGFIEVVSTVHNQSMLISVRDTGMGISSEDQKKLFSKFQQVTTAQKGRPVGTGLGLYISKQYAQKMGGDLWISFSKPGQGSVFTLSVPLAGSELANKVGHSIMQEA